jgi:hypothetical protein
MSQEESLVVEEGGFMCSMPVVIAFAVSTAAISLADAIPSAHSQMGNSVGCETRQKNDAADKVENL